MKIRQHPRMHGILIGDEVYCYPQHLYARVVETFPAAVCVKVAILSINGHLELITSPQLWRADDIENLSVCRYCGTRENVRVDASTGVPFRVCTSCKPGSSVENSGFRIQDSGFRIQDSECAE